MPPLTAIERFFERLFERPSARLFRTRLQPVQLQRRIERAMEAERLAASDRTLVPNRFLVRLHPDDLDGFADMEHDARQRARRRGPRVRPRPPLHARRPPAGRPARRRRRRAHGHPGRRPLRRPDRGRAPARPMARSMPGCRGTAGGDPTHTLVFQVPAPSRPGRAAARRTTPRRDPRGRGRGRPDDRTGHRQRPGPARRAGLAPPRAASAAVAARWSSPTSAAPTAREVNGTGSARSCSAPATGSGSATRVLEVEVAGATT